MKKKIGVIVQARMGSTRLPGKVAKELVGKPMLTHVIERLKESEELDQIIVATSVKDDDGRVIEIAEKENVSTYRGSEADVLSRYIEAAEKYQIDIIIRVTADCPLIDPITIDELIKEFLKSIDLDYMNLKGYPRGLDTGICTLESLKKVERKVKNDPKESQYREHVTLYIYRHPEEFKIDIKEAPEELRKGYRLSVDEVEDFELMENIYNRLYEEGDIIDIKEVLKMLDNEPELAKINADIKQKKY
ncbi:MAG: cytidylyltransferase domain-containing protein [Thermoplasmatota archaeon]